MFYTFVYSGFDVRSLTLSLSKYSVSTKTKHPLKLFLFTKVYAVQQEHIINFYFGLSSLDVSATNHPAHVQAKVYLLLYLNKDFWGNRSTAAQMKYFECFHCGRLHCVA